MAFNLWILAAFVGWILWWISITAGKKLASFYKNKHTALVLKYTAVAIFAFLYLFIISFMKWTELLPALDNTSLCVLLLVAVSWYAWAYFIFKAYEHLYGAVVIIITKLSVFTLYFVNIYLFDWPEHFELPQIILAIVFFLIIIQFAINTKNGKSLKLKNIDKYVLYPFCVSFSTVIFTAWNTWFVKNEIFTPPQSVFATETLLLFAAILAYFIWHGMDLSDIKKSFKSEHLIPLSLIWFGLVWAGTLFYYAYLHNPANIINFMSLLTVFWTAIFSRIFLWDHLSKKQIWLMIAAFIVLIIFVFVDDLMGLM